MKTRISSQSLNLEDTRRAFTCLGNMIKTYLFQKRLTLLQTLISCLLLQPRCLSTLARCRRTSTDFIIKSNSENTQVLTCTSFKRGKSFKLKIRFESGIDSTS